MNILVNFSGKNFEESRLRLNASAVKFGIDKVYSYDESHIRNSEFYNAHQQILEAKVGAGYWLWKPYLIDEAMKSAQEGDIIVYSDAGIEIIQELSPLFEICNEKSIVLFRNAYLRNRYLIKRDCYVLMHCDEKKYWNGPHVDASFCLFRNNQSSRKFVAEWLSWCTDARILTDQPNVMGKKNFWGYKFHRHDQAVLSLLAIRYGLELYRQPSQFGNHYKVLNFRKAGERNCVSQFKTGQVNFYSAKPMTNSPYDQLLDHHRSKSEKIVSEKLTIRKKLIKVFDRRLSKIKKFISRQ